MKIDQSVFFDVMLDLWLREYPGYSDALVQLGPAAAQEHQMRVRLAFGSMLRAIEVGEAATKRWPFRVKAWLDYVMERGWRPEMVAQRYRIPALVVRAYAVRHGLVRFSSIGRMIAWVLRGGELARPVATPAERGYTEQTRVGDEIAVRKPGGLWIPAGAVIAGEL